MEKNNIVPKRVKKEKPSKNPYEKTFLRLNAVHFVKKYVESRNDGFNTIFKDWFYFPKADTVIIGRKGYPPEIHIGGYFGSTASLETAGLIIKAYTKKDEGELNNYGVSEIKELKLKPEEISAIVETAREISGLRKSLNNKVEDLMSKANRLPKLV